MADRKLLELRAHALTHIPFLKVDPVLFEARFLNSCSLQNCNASCCQGGVLLDVTERDNILRHAELVQRHMDGDQVHDPGAWFGRYEEFDSDFPSGKAVGTVTTERGCVFLTKDGRCVLQTAAAEGGLPVRSLKPFFCFAFPITIDRGTLTVDDPDLTNRPECCSMIQQGSRTVLEICPEELAFVLGEEGMKALRELQE